MNNKDFLTYINKIEDRVDIESLKLYNMDTWPIISCFLFKHFVKKQEGYVNNSWFGIFKTRIKHIANTLSDGYKSYNIRKAENLYFGNNTTKCKFGNAYYDYLLQPILEKAPDKSFFIEHGFNLKTPRSYESFQSRILEELSFVLTLVFLPWVKTFKCKRINEFCKEIGFTNRTGLIKYLLNCYILSSLYGLLLDRIKPTTTYITCYYSLTGLAMVHACYKRGITSIDVQHGNIYNNFAYVGWKKVPRNGYNTIPTIFWVWNNQDKKLISEGNSLSFLKKHTPKEKGLPWMNLWKEKSNELVKQYTSNLLKLKDGYKTMILVTLRLSFFKENEWDVLLKLIKKYDKDILWLIRKHPTMGDNFVSSDQSLMSMLKLNQSNVEFQMASEYPLYSLFNVVNLHITTASNAAAEATAFDVPTTFISKLALDEMPYLIDGKRNKILDKVSNLKIHLLKLTNL